MASLKNITLGLTPKKKSLTLGVHSHGSIAFWAILSIKFEEEKILKNKLKSFDRSHFQWLGRKSCLCIRFSVFNAVNIRDGYCLIVQMKRAQNSNSASHVKK